MYAKNGPSWSSARAAWLLKRVGRAQKLRFAPKTRLADATAKLLQKGNIWSNVRSLDLVYFKPELEDVHCGCSHADFCNATAWLLGCASGATFLRLVAPRLPFIPRLPKLRHLQLQGQNIDSLRSSLALLLNLQTLCLKDLDHTSGRLARLHALHNVPRAMFTSISALRFSGLRQLRSLMLDGIVPKSLALAKGAALHIKTRDPEAARFPVWQSVIESLQSFHLDAQADLDGTALQCLSAASNLRVLRLKVKSFGSSDSPIALTGVFQQVERLCLHAQDIFVSFPAGKLPQELVCITSETLYVSFASVAAFADSCRSFYFGWSNMRGLGLIDLRQLLADRGFDYRECISIKSSRLTRGGSSTSSYSQEIGMQGMMCVCGACTICSDKGRCGPDAQFHAQRVPEY